MGAYGIPDDPSLRTCSRLRTWWLRSVRGYKVLRVTRRARPGWFGHLRMEEEYVMLPQRAARH